MGAVLAADFLEFFEEFDFIELIVAIGVSNTIETAAHVLFLIYYGIEGIEGIAEPPGVSDIEVDFFNLRFLESFSSCGAGKAVERSVLIAGNEAAFVVFGQNDP